MICEYCGNPVLLRAGEVKRAYFAHISGKSNCPYTEESEDLFMSKFYLKKHIEKKHSSAKVEVNYKYENRKQSSLYIDIDNKIKTFQIHTQAPKIENWEDKNRYLEELGIKNTWIFLRNLTDERTGIRSTERLSFVIEKSKSLFLFDKEKEILRALRYKMFTKKNGSEEREWFCIDYYLPDNDILTIEEDFLNEYKSANDKFISNWEAYEEREERRRKESESISSWINDLKVKPEKKLNKRENSNQESKFNIAAYVRNNYKRVSDFYPGNGSIESEGKEFFEMSNSGLTNRRTYGYTDYRNIGVIFGRIYYVKFKYVDFFRDSQLRTGRIINTGTYEIKNIEFELLIDSDILTVRRGKREEKYTLGTPNVNSNIAFIYKSY